MDCAEINLIVDNLLCLSKEEREVALGKITEQYDYLTATLVISKLAEKLRNNSK